MKKINILADTHDSDAAYHLEMAMNYLEQMGCADAVRAVAMSIEAYGLANGTPCDVCRDNGVGKFYIDFYELED